MLTRSCNPLPPAGLLQGYPIPSRSRAENLAPEVPQDRVKQEKLVFLILFELIKHNCCNSRRLRLKVEELLSRGKCRFLSENLEE